MLTLREKLVLSFAILILLTAAVSGLSIYHFVRLSLVVDAVLADNYPSIVAAEKMKEFLERQDSAATFYIAGETQRAREQFTKNAELFQQQFIVAAGNITEPGEKEAVADIQSRYADYQSDVDRFLKEQGSAAVLSRTYFSRLLPEFTQVKNRLDDLLQLNELAMKVKGERAKNRARQARQISVAALLVAVALGVVFSWQFTRLVIAPIRLLARSAHQIAEGELDQRIEYRSHDEVGLLAAEFNRMSIRLQELRKSDIGRILMERRKSDAVIDGLYEPVVVTDSEGNLLKLNRAAQHALGLEAGKRLDQSPLGEQLLSAVKKAVEMQRPLADEGEMSILPLRLGDAERSYRLRTAPMRDDAGRLSGAITVLEDVTALREVDRFKNKFIQIASRKLQEPLQALRLSLHSLAHGYAGPLKSDQEEIVYTAEQTAEELDTLIADLLEISEVDSGARVLNLERMRPIAITREAVARHEAASQTKRILLEHKTYPDLAGVMADRRSMRSIFDNLLANAIEFTPEDGHIVVGAHEKENFVVFYVKDSGIGIAAERLPRIFGRFSTQRTDGKGAGLGLALVRRLVEAQGGQASVESKIGEGSTFSFTLPLARALPRRHLVEEG